MSDQLMILEPVIRHPDLAHHRPCLLDAGAEALGGGRVAVGAVAAGEQAAQPECAVPFHRVRRERRVATARQPARPERLNFRVRDGNGCDPLGIATEKSLGNGDLESGISKSF